MFIKEKRDGKIKARGCADGSKQREKYNTKDATSPEVYIEVVLISMVIDEYKEQDVSVVDIPCVYLSAYMDDDVFIIFRGTMAELMVAADPTIYRKYNSYTKK